MKAIWNKAVLAESDDIVLVEGNCYFPKTSLNMQHFEPSHTTSFCSWKGQAHYYSIITAGEKNRDAAWYYPSPTKEAMKIKNRVAFWKGVEVID